MVSRLFVVLAMHPETHFPSIVCALVEMDAEKAGASFKWTLK